MKKKASKDMKNRKSRNEIKASSLGLKDWFWWFVVFVCMFGFVLILFFCGFFFFSFVYLFFVIILVGFF